MSRLAALTAGITIGDDFTIVEPLGEGGMGAVYIVEQRSTGVRRALKLMHPHLVEDEALRKRFELEARVGARIESDFVAGVLAAGVDKERQIPWIAMELLQGEDLATRMRRDHFLDADQAYEVLEPLCDALAAAHRIGVVHRDLKPENVFLAKPRRVGERFTVKVLDFGIAKLLAEASTTATAPVGTPTWMAPEQTTLGETVTPSADVWALGLLTFALLAGRRYWLAANVAVVEVMPLLREIAFEPLEPASERAKRLLARPTLPAGFDAWFGRCVVRDRDVRFKDASEAWKALAPILRAHVDSHAETRRADRTDHRKFVEAETMPSAPLPPAPPVPIASNITAPGASITNPAVGPTVTPRRSLKMPLVLFAALLAGGGSYAFIKLRAKDPAAMAAAEAKKRPMATLAGASFTMGSLDGAENERPPTRVTVMAMLIDTEPVTAESYRVCVDAGVCPPPNAGEYCTYGDPARAKHPMNCVSHAQATAYCTWLGRRLPTEMEWEFAAAGADGRPYPWGKDEPDPTRLCWDRCAEKGGTCAVGSYPQGATPEGVQDMAGNTWEWTSSAYCPYNNLTCGDPRRVVRGGGWCGADQNLVRTRSRSDRNVTDATSNIGFRCARSL